ncbi:MAG TPA: hypothetical protein VKB45_16930 [Gemmatimonadales bacterium]|nr:hypothetical protein [Gemmatimonadales bacterium]
MIDTPAFDQADAEALVDPRLRGLVERYALLAGATVQELEPQLVELDLPDAEMPRFWGRRSLRVAFSPAALERHPDAEIAVLGSPFVQELLGAVRARGARRAFGVIPATQAADWNGLPRTFAVRKGSAEPPVTSLALRPVARLVARVRVTAGAIVAEHIVESAVFDLATGVRVPDDVAGLCRDIEAGTLEPATDDGAAGAMALQPRSLSELVPLMLGDIEVKLTMQLARHRRDADQALAAELGRIDRYYLNMQAEAGPAGESGSAEERRAIAGEHRRRRADEQRRYEVRATVHPLQLVEFSVPVQRVDWALVTQTGRRATFTAERTLVGSGDWQVACPHCGAIPKELLIDRHNHVACGACGKTCRVCGDAFGEGDGIAACHVDEEPACEAHARTCSSCGLPHCSTHAGTCSAGDHPACSTCLGPCGVCGKVVCATHAVRSDAGSPRGQRRLCNDCMVYCEGKTNEPVGRDEAVRCSSCEELVCTNHRAACVVDQHVHCSTHLRRADRSRRLVCERHQGWCDHEKAVVFASDEVADCAACGKSVCDAHFWKCAADNCPRLQRVSGPNAQLRR